MPPACFVTSLRGFPVNKDNRIVGQLKHSELLYALITVSSNKLMPTVTFLHGQMGNQLFLKADTQAFAIWKSTKGATDEKVTVDGFSDRLSGGIAACPGRNG